MKKYFEFFVLASALLLLNAMVASAVGVTYTGDVDTDFMSFMYEDVVDPVGDVGIPDYAPVGTVSGWEIERVVFYLDIETYDLQIGLDAYGIAGDVAAGQRWC